MKSLITLLLAMTMSFSYAQTAGLKAGEQCPDFTFNDGNGKEYTLASFAGKYIFIDIWATWCGPCVGQIPSLKTLEGKMHGKNIVFMSLSTDKNIDDWKKMVRDKKLGGVQLHFGGNRDFVNAFALVGIPRFILIGPDGKVVNPDLMRPSSGKVLVDYLLSLPEMESKNADSKSAFFIQY